MTPTDVPDALDLPPRRRRADACLSDRALDALALEELPVEARAAAETHLAACAACAAARDALAGDRAAYLARADVPTLAADALARAASARRPRFLSRLSTVLGVATAAAAAVLVLSPRPHGTGTRTKGGFSLTTYVQHAESPGQGTLHAGEPVHPGDKIQFRVGADVRGYLAILAVDAAGAVSVYYPPGADAEPIGPGRDLPLATAVELDDTLGGETVIALLCRRPMAVAALAAAVRDGDAELPCVRLEHHLDKSRPPPRP